MLAHLYHRRERRLAKRDINRLVFPFEWGASFIAEGAETNDPRHVLRQHTRDVLKSSDEFYALPPVTDYRLAGDVLTWTSAVETIAPENNTAQARFFPVSPRRKRQGGRRAVVVLPQWNADSASHVALCRLLSRFGIAALRVTLPFHEGRRRPELKRAEHLVSPNIGRTLQSMRQAVLDARAAAGWLTEQAGFDRVGVLGTSIGSCIAFLAFAHDSNLRVGVFNHVSGYVADVVWRGISTQHVRAGFGNSVTLDELREYWLPISPLAYTEKLARMPPRLMRFIAARYDLTFPLDLSRDVITEAKRLGLPFDVAWLPCGHYTLGENPWKYLDGWKIISFFKRNL